jgi:hypothetical protein
MNVHFFTYALKCTVMKGTGRESFKCLHFDECTGNEFGATGLTTGVYYLNFCISEHLTDVFLVQGVLK